MVADAAGGMMKLEDRRFEKGDWPISFEIPVAGEQAESWSRYLKWGCHKRGWSASSLGQLERQENSGTTTVTGDDGAPKLDIVWEHRRDGPLKVRARLGVTSGLSIADAEQFFRDINNDCSGAVTTNLYVRGTLQYDLASPCLHLPHIAHIVTAYSAGSVFQHICILHGVYGRCQLTSSFQPRGLRTGGDAYERPEATFHGAAMLWWPLLHTTPFGRGTLTA